ncbi:DUF3710 domain-containing protein [Corynebacterium guangdongense]|uniref:Antitoxin component of MazEF toxin-antitoxin module n=1 Tax=Corynebacterium guangdongense TaxID=1783348 RepID=A0ABU1ZX47_9CORY|nr:DUF3710 domain-containing protein [Corynebacterium guangdongense]MDR7329486.1 antitoxin component of MazEF toxin-antitoxin module [Corynebacterium guangdongense]WJZ18051.1 hypothetical protein CGUA_07445 [Corynebacterium guangdongense]
MALWPFGKKKDEPVVEDGSVNAAPAQQDTPVDDAVQEQATTEGEGIRAVVEHDAVDGTAGPFDGDNVAIEDFDFTDYSTGILNLGSMRLPLPKGSQVQVEMGEQGPKMIHIVTTAGRITPVAFAAPKASGQWEQASAEVLEGMRSQGMADVHYEQGPWGREIVGSGPQAAIRIVGIEGPRWMLRFTLTAPLDKTEELASIGRELAARTFVYRGQDPILAGNSLPVSIPPQLVQQVQEEMKRRQEQAQANQQAVATAQNSESAAEARAAMDAFREAINKQLKNNPADGPTDTGADTEQK